MISLPLPRADGSLERYSVRNAPIEPHFFDLKVDETDPMFFNRMAYAAAHVVIKPLAAKETIDWDATMAFRRHLWSLGLGVAEAMDTAQRGMGLDWPAAQELMRRSIAEAHSYGPLYRPL